MTTILWRSTHFESSEYCQLSATDTGHRLSGVVLLPNKGRPEHLRYRVDVDYGWRTRRVTVVAEHGRALVMTTDGEGTWVVDGAEMPEFAGCLDIDLGFSPSTNTLPIRRLTRSRPDEKDLSADVRAVWLRFPEWRLEVLDQTYRRVTEKRWAYQTGPFSADLSVDWSGLVQAYKTDDGNLFEAVVSSD